MAGDGNTVECDRCEGTVALEEAVELRQTGNKQMVKTLCPGCLESVGTPRGYKLKRDLSYRAR
ncbi:MAG: hypothetical protein ABEH77_01735 [Halobacteriaceae archaeon]